jgi:hypothetical protein
MRVPHYNVGIKGDECQCGRRASIVHCPFCGSTRRYARKNRMHRMLDGTDKFVKAEYCCMTCAHEYIEEEREFCEAPPIGEKLAKQKAKALDEAGKTEFTPTEKTAAEAVLKMLRSGTPLEEIKTPPPALTEEERNKMVTELKREHLHHLLAFNAGQRNDHPGPIEKYVEDGIKQFEQDWIKMSRA